MKTHWFLALSIAGVVLLAGSVIGGELRWGKPADSTPAVSSVMQIPTVITADKAVKSVEVVQTQYVQPGGSPRLAPPVVQSDLDPIETRPLDRPVPPGAMLSTDPQNMMPQIMPDITPTSPDQMATNPPETGREMATTCGNKIVLKSIREISHDIRPAQAGPLPEECVLEYPTYYGRNFSQTCFMWKASALSTQAAYFEDVQLERYGNTIVCPSLQPVISGVKFFATVPILPYKMGVTPPNECVYTLGHRRPGSCAPYMVEPFPISPRGALFQAGAVAGTIFVIP